MRLSLTIFILSLINVSYSFNLYDYYAYYSDGKIICSEKEFNKSNQIFNEYEMDNGFTCLFDNKKDNNFRIKLHIDKINNDSDNKMLDIQLGNIFLTKSLEINRINSYIIDLLIKIEDNNLKFAFFNKCTEDCLFLNSENSIFMGRFLKFEFILNENNTPEIVLLEKASIKPNIADECDPKCINGICQDGDCLCLGGYMGANCSVST